MFSSTASQHGLSLAAALQQCTGIEPMQPLETTEQTTSVSTPPMSSPPNALTYERFDHNHKHAFISLEHDQGDQQGYLCCSWTRFMITLDISISAAIPSPSRLFCPYPDALRAALRAAAPPLHPQHLLPFSNLLSLPAPRPILSSPLLSKT